MAGLRVGWPRLRIGRFFGQATADGRPVKTPCGMALWELRKRWNAFSAVPPLRPSVLTICADCRTANEFLLVNPWRVCVGILG